MPIYEYECQACGHTLDALQKISEGPLRKCPECQQLKLKKLMSAPKFRLKGEGWYETDFKSDNQRNLADSGDASASDKPGAEKSNGDKAADAKSPKDKKAKAGDSKSADKPVKKKSASKPDDGKAA